MSRVAAKPRKVVAGSPAVVRGVDAEAPVPVADGLPRDATDDRVVVAAKPQLVDVGCRVALVDEDAGTALGTTLDGVVHLHKVHVEEVVLIVMAVPVPVAAAAQV